MAQVRVKRGESIDHALQRFKKQVRAEGIFTAVRNHEHYDSPSVKRKRKSMAARKRNARRR